jgi:hypothetical protein
MFEPDPFVRGAGHEKLNRELGKRPHAIEGSDYIAVNRTGGRMTVSVRVDKLRERMGGRGSGGVLVKVISDAAGGGKYIGREWITSTSSAVVALTGNLTEAELGQTGTTDILILNTSEVGESTHALTEGTPKTKIFIAYQLPGIRSDEGTPKDVYVIPGFDWTLECETAE